MVDDRITALREMAKHRGFSLKTSRRRKAGGDFGKFGLEDASGKPALGIGEAGLEASADDVEAFLRDAERATWATSTAGVKRVKAPPAPKVPKPRPKPRFKVAVGNLFAKLPPAKRDDAVTELLAARGVRVERIVSRGQVAPEDQPLRQDHDEWVLMLGGQAALRIEDSDEVTLVAGDHVTIARGQQRWVTRTSAEPPAVWLAIHLI